uniref:Uncharacterized protein n=1 Tax=Toxoplasma gondii COUG TaxID=1074873 RepID=A0A2G8XVG0_TOXGO|nr:hypothetical protein TGCOUG_394460 [Toxoplasma gondii COUG]
MSPSGASPPKAPPWAAVARARLPAPFVSGLETGAVGESASGLPAGSSAEEGEQSSSLGSGDEEDMASGSTLLLLSAIQKEISRHPLIDCGNSTPPLTPRSPVTPLDDALPSPPPPSPPSPSPPSPSPLTFSFSSSPCAVAPPSPSGASLGARRVSAVRRAREAPRFLEPVPEETGQDEGSAAFPPVRFLEARAEEASSTCVSILPERRALAPRTTNQPLDVEKRPGGEAPFLQEFRGDSERERREANARDARERSPHCAGSGDAPGTCERDLREETEETEERSFAFVAGNSLHQSDLVTSGGREGELGDGREDPGGRRAKVEREEKDNGEKTRLRLQIARLRVTLQAQEADLQRERTQKADLQRELERSVTLLAARGDTLGREEEDLHALSSPLLLQKLEGKQREALLRAKMSEAAELAEVLQAHKVHTRAATAALQEELDFAYRKVQEEKKGALKVGEKRE